MKALYFAGALTVFALPATASEFQTAAQEFFETEIAAWANDPALVTAIVAQNSETGGYDQSQIDALDQAWRSEIGMTSTPTISPVMTNQASAFLRERVEEYSGRITEIFVMDSVGLNVAASSVTSDYWQGDEAKFSETYSVGPDGFHVSDIELDESTQRYQGQVSFTIVDPATGQPVGAMTIGVDAEALM